MVVVDSDVALFKKFLKAHQEGESDYLTFCEQCARTGVEKWMVDVGEMRCIYYEVNGEKVLDERIPG